MLRYIPVVLFYKIIIASSKSSSELQEPAVRFGTQLTSLGRNVCCFPVQPYKIKLCERYARNMKLFIYNLNGFAL